MGFECILNNKRTNSFSLSDDAWVNLKATYKQTGLAIACCGAQCIPKENQLGTRFFAHKDLTDCPYADIKDPKELVYLKYLIGRTLAQLGWDVQLSKKLDIPNAEPLVANIYAEKGKAKFAFEIEWDATDTDYVTRHDQMLSIGVKSAFFLRVHPSKGFPYKHYDALTKRKLGAFPFKYDTKKKVFNVFNVYLPCENFRPSFIPTHLEVVEFLHNLFNGSIHIIGKAGAQYNMNAQYLTIHCSNCQEKINYLYMLGYCPANPPSKVQVHVASPIEVPLEHIEQFNRELAESCGIAPLQLADVTGRRVNNVCAHCHAPQQNIYGNINFQDMVKAVSRHVPLGIQADFPEHSRMVLLPQQA